MDPNQQAPAPAPAPAQTPVSAPAASDIPVTFPPNTSPGPLDPEPPKKKIGLLIAIIVAVVLVLGLAGTAFAAMRGWITLPFGLLAQKPSTTNAPTIEEIAAAMATVQSGNATVSIAFQVQPKQEGTPAFPTYPELPKPIPATSTSELGLRSTPSRTSYLAQFLSTDTRITAEFSNAFDNGASKNLEGSLKGSYSSSGLSLAFDGAYRRVNEDLYLQIKSLPIPILDFPAISGMWIALSEDSLGSFSLFGGGSDPELEVWKYDTEATSTQRESFTDQQNKFAAELKILVNELFAKRAIVLGDGELLDATTSAPFWRFDVTYQPQAVREAIVAAVDGRPDAEKPQFLTDALKNNADRDVFVAWLQDFAKTQRIQVDVDAGTRIPVRQTLTGRYIPDEPELASRNQEHVLTVTYALHNPNQPVTVTAPPDVIPFKKAMQIISHQTDEEVLFNEQTRIISDLRNALARYNSTHQTYPTALSELIGLKFYSSTVVRVPNDRVTGQPFIYRQTDNGRDYELQYQIRLPKKDDTAGSLNDFYAEDDYAEGTNTATKAHKSKEASEANDDDKDGLNNALEAILGTNPLLADTDRDGYSDKQESESGNDPLTNSKTGAVIKPYVNRY